jgi:hypothetical protein
MGIRYLLATVGLLYAAFCVLLVHGQAEAYRRALRERRPEDQAPDPRPVAPPPAVAVATPRPNPAPIAPPTSRPAVPVAPPPPPSPPPPPAQTSVPAAPAATNPPLIVRDLENLPPAEETRLGRLLHQLVLSNHPADEDSPFQRAVSTAAGPMIEMRTRKEVGVTITVLDSDEVNAFSHLGGYVYMTRGLFNLAASEEEYRFVVGHELAHADLKHAAKLVDEAVRQGRLGGVGTLQALYHQIAAGYTEDQEREADDWVIERMIRLDHTRRECLAFLRKLTGLSERLGFRNGRKSPRSDLDAAVQDVENAIRSQPAAWSRLDRLTARLKPDPARAGAAEKAERE